MNERHVEPGADVKREREGKDWKGKGVRERGIEGEGTIVLLCLTIERQRGDVRERERERRVLKTPEPLSMRWVFGVLVGSRCSGFASIAV